MKKIFFGLVFLTASLTGFAQIKVGGNPTIDPNAMLEIDAVTNKGLLLPRLELEETTNASPLSAHVEGMTVYNTARTNDVVPGFYYNDGNKWQQMVTTDYKAVKFFYMPSITFDTSADATGQTKDLYAEYKAQFALTNPNHVASTGAPTANGIPYFANARDLYYYITDYDPNVFSNITVNEDGLMTYDVTAAATDCTLINIVFVVKE